MPFTDFDAWLTTQADTENFSGVVLIRRGVETLFEGAYGLASRRWNVPVTAATRFDIASVTKLFTSVAALQLVDQGLLTLDTTVTSLVDLAGTTIPADVTLRHLLTHTSGIADDADEEAGEEYSALFVDRPCYSVMTTRDFLPQFAHKPPNFPAGTGCRYCNVGYVLAGMMIEAVTGRTFREYVVDAVFARAGMKASGFFDRRDAEPDVAEGWDLVDGRWEQNIFKYPPIGSPDGGAHVTAADMVTFVQAVRAGTMMSPESTELFLTPQVLHDKDDRGFDVRYAFGLEFNFGIDDGDLRTWYKEGINPGSSAIVRHYPVEGIDLVVLSNTEDGAWEPIREVHRRLRAARPELGSVNIGG